MMHIEQRLALFRDMIGCCHKLYLWQYSRDINLMESNCPEESILNELFASSKLVDALPQTCIAEKKPVLMSNDLGLMWINVPSFDVEYLQYIHVLGPFFLYDISVSQIEAELHRRKLTPELKQYVMSFLRSLPVISLNRAVAYTQMLHFCVTGENISADEIAFLDSRSESIPSEELRTVHGTYEAEKEMLRLVREGDLNYRSHMKVIAGTGRVGNIADGTTLRQLKNMLIVNITLFSRAAMEGGLPPETAYSLSDHYFQTVERTSSLQSLKEINSAMQEDFVQRVHQFRQNSALSKPIRICLEQMQTRMEEPISIEEFARSFGYSPYYLSKKFKAETGRTFKDHLRQIRLERARFLLQNTDASILDISERLQFCSASYFSDAFRKAYGMSPTAFREQL